MTEQPRSGLITGLPEVELKGEIKTDEVYVVADQQGQPAAVAEWGGLDVVVGWQAHRVAALRRQTNCPSAA